MDVEMVSSKSQFVGNVEEGAHCSGFCHGAIDVIWIIVEATLLAKPQNTTPCFHLINAAVAG